VTLITQGEASGRTVAIAGGGSDLLGMMKERLVAPDVLVNLKTIKGLESGQDRRRRPDDRWIDHARRAGRASTDPPAVSGAGRSGGGRGDAADSQRRDARRQTSVSVHGAGTYRNGFACLKNGGTTCYSVSGENAFHAIFGGGPSHIVHPSDTAPALVALDAKFRIVGPAGERVVPAADFLHGCRPSTRRARTC